MLFLCSCVASCLHSYFIITPHISSTGSKMNVDAIMQQNRNIYVVLMQLCSFMSPQLFYNNTSYRQHWKQSECECSHAAKQKYMYVVLMQLCSFMSPRLLLKNTYFFSRYPAYMRRQSRGYVMTTPGRRPSPPSLVIFGILGV